MLLKDRWDKAAGPMVAIGMLGAGLVLFAAACSRHAPAAGGLPAAFNHSKDGAPMVRVPAGAFTMGTDEVHPDLPSQARSGSRPLKPYEVSVARADPDWRAAAERPARQVKLAAFAMDTQEVSNARYERFLAWIERTADHSGCHPDEPKGKDHRPRYWRDFNPLLANAAHARTLPFGAATFRAPDKPVVGVDWFDAWAYAAWAGKRLPTAAEWERAARGTDGRRWPWGNDWRWRLANTGGEKLGRDVPAKGMEHDGWIYAAPVGSFPAGRSPAGCDDMAGNAAEWVADGWRHGERQVRGGSSRNLPSGVRCVSRTYREAEYRDFDLGFRCAKSE